MDKTRFWTLIETTFDADCEKHTARFKVALLRLSADEVMECERIFDEYEVALYRWDLWGVAYLIGGGCSDDGFSDFREMIIRRGQKFYDAMLADPEKMALEADLKQEDFYDMFSQAIIEAYEELTGKSFLDLESVAWPKNPSGKDWEEDDLEALFPTLWQKFS